MLAFIVGMPSMVRTRFATPTIGREWMIGELGEVVEAVDPDGVVERRRGPLAGAHEPGDAGQGRRRACASSPSTASRSRSSRSRAQPRTTASAARRLVTRRVSGPLTECEQRSRPIADHPMASYGDPVKAVTLIWQTSGACRNGTGTDFYPPMHTERKHERLARERRAKSVCASCPSATSASSTPSPWTSATASGAG